MVTEKQEADEYIKKERKKHIPRILKSGSV